MESSRFLEGLLLALTYFVAAKVCHFFSIEPGNVTPIWVASGISFTWVYHRGFSILPGVFLGAFIGNVSAYIFPIHPGQLLPAISAGVLNGAGDTLSIFFAVYILKKTTGAKNIIHSISGTSTFIFLSAIFASFISALFGVTGLLLLNFIERDAYEMTLLTWLIGDTLGILILSPFLEALFIKKSYRDLKFNYRKILETTVGFIIISLLCYGHIREYEFYNLNTQLFSLLVIPLFVIGAFRNKEFTVYLLLFFLSSYILFITIFLGDKESLNSELINSQIFIFSLASTILYLVSTLKQVDFLNVQVNKSMKLAAIGEMSAGIVHEINNPLTVAKTSMVSLQRYCDDNEKAKSHLARVERSVDKMVKIVKGLKNFSRKGERVDSKTLVNFRDVVKESITMTEILAQKKNVALQVEELSDVKVNCNIIQIEQVIVNLIQNAIDEMSDYKNGWIKLRMIIKQKKVELIVIDAGEGIDGATVENIFKAFFTTKESQKGVGLGLSISKKLAIEHGGSLDYRLTDGHTSFVLSLPIDEN